MRPLLALAALLGLAGCIPSSVVAPEQREVALPVLDVHWRPATPEDVPGTWASELVDGPMAAVLMRVYYRFDADGTYTGAALVQGASTPSFQVLNGTWSLEEGRLRLDDAAPGVLESGEDRLRLSGEEGSVVLRREAGS